jgi:DNA-binding PadR family transcriptional regulator
MQTGFLRELLDLIEAFEREGGNTNQFDREAFASWLITYQRDTGKKQRSAPGPGPRLNGLIAMYLNFMGRYAQFYSRRIFRSTEIYSDDDWGILVSLFPDRQMKKTEVLRGCIMEKSSGNEVLKRLLKQGLIQETPHPEDRRSKLVTLTDAGRAAFMSVQNGIERFSDVVVADLSEDEKASLLQMLTKLHHFHKPIFEAADEETLGEMLGQTIHKDRPNDEKKERA